MSSTAFYEDPNFVNNDTGIAAHTSKKGIIIISVITAILAIIWLVIVIISYATDKLLLKRYTRPSLPGQVGNQQYIGGSKEALANNLPLSSYSANGGNNQPNTTKFGKPYVLTADEQTKRKSQATTEINQWNGTSQPTSDAVQNELYGMIFR